jgi:hypothetical protein
VPVEDVDEIPAERRAEQRSRDRAEAEEGAREAVLFGRIAREEDALRGRDDRSAADALFARRD